MSKAYRVAIDIQDHEVTKIFETLAANGIVNYSVTSIGAISGTSAPKPLLLSARNGKTAREELRQMILNAPDPKHIYTKDINPLFMGRLKKEDIQYVWYRLTQSGLIRNVKRGLYKMTSQKEEPLNEHR